MSHLVLVQHFLVQAHEQQFADRVITLFHVHPHFLQLSLQILFGESPRAGATTLALGVPGGQPCE